MAKIYFRTGAVFERFQLFVVQLLMYCLLDESKDRKTGVAGKHPRPSPFAIIVLVQLQQVRVAGGSACLWLHDGGRVFQATTHRLACSLERASVGGPLVASSAGQ